MTATRIAVVGGVVVFGILCWLAAIGFTPLVGPLVTVAVLVVLVAAGSWLSSGRSAPPGGPGRGAR